MNTSSSTEWAYALATLLDSMEFPEQEPTVCIEYIVRREKGQWKSLSLEILYLSEEKQRPNNPGY